MFFVHRTHGKITNHWGFTTVGIYDTLDKAKEFANKHLQEHTKEGKIVITQAIHTFYIKDIVIDDAPFKPQEDAICC